MSITAAGDHMKSDWPHWRCALRGPFLVTEVRWFMIYFPITPSLLSALGPPVNNHKAWLSTYTFPPTSTPEASTILPSSAETNWKGFPHLLIQLIRTRVFLIIGTREGMVLRLKRWMTELQWCWIQLEVGRLHTPGPPGRWWGLRVT